MAWLAGPRWFSLRRPIFVTSIYAVLAAGWIYASDALLGFLIPDPAILTTLETYKGWLFVAITSALLFAMLRNAEGGRNVESGGRLSIWPPLAILFVFVAVVAATAFLVYQHIARAARSHAQDTVSAVADLKVRQLADWIEHRRNEAESLSADPLLTASDDPALVLGHLETLRRLHGWTRTTIVDATGAIRADAGTSDETAANLAALAWRATRSGGVVFSDLHRTRSAALFGFAAPLRGGGAIVMEIAPDRTIDAMMQGWPLPSQSGETLLVRRDGNSVVYLTRLRHNRAPELTLRLPIDRDTLVAARAVRGARGAITGHDYRGVPVLAAVRSIPGTPWLLIAKEDLGEVNGPIAGAARLVALFGAVLVAVAMLTTAFWLQRQRANAALRELELDRERTVLAKHLDYLTRYANDIILLIEENGTILDANERAVAAYGYSRAELIGGKIQSLRPASQLANFSDQWRQAGDTNGAVFETMHQRKDGSVFPVEVSSRGIDVEGTTLRQSIIRDITDRKEAERKIVRLTNLYAAISDMSQAIVRVTNRDDLLAEICRVAVEFGGLQYACVKMVGPGSQLDVVAAHGQKPAATPVANLSAAFPLLSGSEAIGTLTVYAREPGFFDKQTRALLEEMTSDVSFALDNLKKEEQRRGAEASLRESEEKYRLLFSREQDGVVLFDMKSSAFIDANDAFLRMTGFAKSDIGTMPVDQIIHDEGRVKRKNGSEFLAEVDLNTFVWRGREVVSAIVRDITDKKKAEENALLWANVLEDSSEGIVITDTARRILTINKAFSKLTGYTPEEAVGATPRILKSGRHDAGFYHVMWRTIRESGRWQGEIWNRRKNGEIYLEWLSITAVHNADGKLTHYVGIFSDITEREAAARRIEFLASHDFLTGLPNRSLIIDLIRQAVANAQRRGKIVAVLFLDLDRFKTINDSLGHATGDTLLQRVAMAIKEAVRGEDTVARIGGDEFLIMLPELAHNQDAALVAEKIMNSVKRVIVIDNHELSVTASIGISLFPHDGDDVTALTRNADAAMYHAKERGRNNYQFFTPDMNARASEALSMSIRLRAALERDEFLLHYQPQVRTASGQIIGAEALIRWNQRDLGSVEAQRFIPIAEEHGLIVPIGEWVLRSVCTQLRRWLDEGLAIVPVGVNMSAMQFRQPGLAARIRRVLDETGVTPNYLELEVTESVLMHDADQTISVLRELDEMGVSLAIDDFGTGYSSLNYLRRFPIRRLKIDQSFVRDINVNPDAAAIAAAIVSMGRSLKLRVIAEGVETAEQLEFLARRDCDELQGYYIGRPVEAEKFAEILRQAAVPRPV